MEVPSSLVFTPPPDPVGFTAEKAKSLPVQPNSSFIGFKNSGSVTFDDGLKIPTLRRSWVQVGGMGGIGGITNWAEG